MSFALIYLFIAFTTKLFKVTGKLSYKLLFYLFGRYGKVVSKEDWKNIKKCHKEFYKEAVSKKSCGFCYYFSWTIALHLKDAKLLYCSQRQDVGHGGHAVIVKNNCVYDTNNRRHYDYKEYLELFDIVVYKIFKEEEYRKESFFDDIRPGFVEWCKENNVYCDPPR